MGGIELWERNRREKRMEHSTWKKYEIHERKLFALPTLTSNSGEMYRLQ